MRNRTILVAILTTAILIFATGVAWAQVIGAISLNPGERVDVACIGGGDLVLNRPVKLPDGSNDKSQGRLVCRQNANPTQEPTPEPTATALPPTATPEPTATAAPPAGEPFNRWHAPGAHDGLNVHEHGHEPPAWAEQWSLANFGHGVIYGGDEATPGENVKKHQAFKGYLFTLNANGCPVEIFVRVHAQTNPMGHMARFHSFESYWKDCQGGISLMQGWLDYASANNQEGPNTYYKNCGEQGIRPVISRNTQACGPAKFEDWYSAAGGTYDASAWMPDTGQNLSPTAYAEGDPHNSDTWARTGDLGLTRRVEIAWYKNRASYVFNTYGGGFDRMFYTDQWGRPVSGPGDPVCGSTQTFGSLSFTVNCIPQYVASTLPEVSFGTTGGRNAAQFEFPGAAGLDLPN